MTTKVNEGQDLADKSGIGGSMAGRVFTAEEKVERAKWLQKDGGLTTAEANRVVYGWSEPSMATFWKDLWNNRDPDAPPLEQKDAYYLIIKTSFGTDFSEEAELELNDRQMKEVCKVLVDGILAGRIYRRSNTKRAPTPENLMQTARTELSRILGEDARFSNIQRKKSA